MTPAHDRHVAEWNATDRAYPRHLMLHQLVERHVAATPDAIAVMHRSQAVTYAALDARAIRWARRLQSLGIGPDATVGVHLDRAPELIAVLLGILKARGAYVPLDPAYPREHLEYIATDARLSALITGREGARPGPAVPVLRPDAGDDKHQPGDATVSRAARVTGGAARGSAAPGNLAYVLYTSGSTGRPKGVAITHANAVDLLYWAAEVFAADLERVLATTSICFDCSVLEIFGPLSRGGTVVLAEAPTDIGARLEGTQVRLIHTVPSIVNDLLDADQLPAAVRTAIVGGEALWPGLAEKVYERSSVERLVNLYGPAECTSYASMATVDRSPAGVPPIGRPVANTRIYVLDPDGSPVSAEAEGEICIAGEGLARGYLHRPALTAERFVPEPFSGRLGVRMYRTGDVGRHGDEGDLMFCGRIDDQVKIRGVRVEPGEVERALLEHAAVREAAVRAAGGDGRGVLAAYVVPAGTDARPETLRAFLHQRLPSPLVPDVFVILDHLPRTPNGKIDRRRLPEAFVPASCAAAQPPPPARTAWEEVLAELWARALEAGDIGVDADLFGFGGHSLAALRVRARLSELLGQDVPVRLLFDHPTIAGMAAEIARRFTQRPPRKDRATAWPPPASDRAALSPMQLAILNRADERADAAGLLLPVGVRLSGQLNTGALVQALAAVTQRHAVLRSVVATQRDGSHRLVAAPRPATRHPGLPHDVLPLVDLRGMPPRHREEIAVRVAQALFARPLRVRADPPLRLGLLRLSDTEHVLLFALHHIAGDAWSVETLCHQVLSAYAAALHGRAAAVPAPVQYADWAAEQRRRLLSSSGRAQHAYWRSQLQDLPVLRLPGDGHRPEPVGEIVRTFSLVPGPTTTRVGDFGREEKATPYMVLTAAFAVLLHQWSGQTDLVIGSPHAGRTRSELATVVGPCQDALVLRCDLSGDPSFRDVIRRVRDRALSAHANSDVPFVLLSAEFGREPGRHPLYQASIVLQQWPSLLDPRYRELLFSREPIGDLQISEFTDGPTGSTALDVEMMLFEWDGELEIVLDCRGDVVSAGEASMLAADFLIVLQDSLRHPDKQISEFLPVMERSSRAPIHPSLLSS